jgi:GT2 family glycosyltransferase
LDHQAAQTVKRRASSEAHYKMNPHMDCSVIIATYNRLPMLSRCLDCLRRQDLAPGRFEIVVVDDGSTDGTSDAVCTRRDDVVVALVSCGERRGPAAARNRGLEVARGDIVVFVDDDTLVPSWFLSEHVRTHRRHQALIVDGPAITIGSQANLLTPPFEGLRVRLMAGLDVFGRAFATVNASARLSDLRRCGGFDEALLAWEDVDLGRRLRAMGLGRRRNRRAYVLHWKGDPVSLDARLLLAEERGRYAAAYYQRYQDPTARWQARLRYLRYDAALLRCGLAGRYEDVAPGGGSRQRRPIVALELIHAYATGLRTGLRQPLPLQSRGTGAVPL